MHPDPEQMLGMYCPHAIWMTSGPNTLYKCKSISRHVNPNYSLGTVDVNKVWQSIESNLTEAE